MSKKINVIEKLVIVPERTHLRFPSLQFELEGKELIEVKHECTDKKCEHESHRKVLNKKEKKAIKKEYIPVKIRRRLTFVNNSLLVDVIKNDKDIVENPEQLSGENGKRLVRAIDEFITRDEIKEKIFEYFSATDEDER